MRTIKSLFCFLIFVNSSFSQQNRYVLGEDSKRQEGLPKGVATKHVWKSSLLNGTIRADYLYIPAQYNPKNSAALTYKGYDFKFEKVPENTMKNML